MQSSYKRSVSDVSTVWHKTPGLGLSFELRGRGGTVKASGVLLLSSCQKICDDSLSSNRDTSSPVVVCRPSGGQPILKIYSECVTFSVLEHLWYSGPTFSDCWARPCVHSVYVSGHVAMASLLIEGVQDSLGTSRELRLSSDVLI